MLYVTLLLLHLLYPRPVQASPQQAWQKANALYGHKQYDSAAVYFEKIAAGRPADPAIYYNLGNTYYRLNRIGPAVLNYERALRRKPGYKAAAENLLLTQSRIPGRIAASEDIFFVRWWQAITAPGRIILWSVLSLLLFMSLIGLLLYRRLSRRKAHIRPQVIGGITVLWLLTLFLALSAAKAAISNLRGVIMQGNVSLFREPAAGARSPLASLPEGTTVKIDHASGNWYQVTLPDGRTGWLQQAAVRIVD